MTTRSTGPVCDARSSPSCSCTAVKNDALMNGAGRPYPGVGRLTGMGIAEVVSAPASPWQNPYVERLIGSLRRECLDHVIVLNEAHLRCVLTSYSKYYNDVSYCPTSLCA